MTELDELKKHTKILKKILKVLLLSHKTHETAGYPQVPKEE